MSTAAEKYMAELSTRSIDAATTPSSSGTAEVHAMLNRLRRMAIPNPQIKDDVIRVDALAVTLKEAANLIERLSGIAKASWQPIKTAPKDGTCVLIVDDDTDMPVVAFYQGKQWLVRWDHEVFGNPTMWAPLPTGSSVPSTDRP